MKVSDFTGKSCFIFPKSTLTDVFKKHLEAFEVDVKGFVDNHKTGPDIVNLSAIGNGFDFIFIFSPNHANAIYTQVADLIDRDKIVLVQMDLINSSYIFSKGERPAEDALLSRSLETSFDKNEKKYTLEDSILLIGINFIDLNLKYLYLYLRRHGKQKVYLASNNKRDVEIFSRYGIDVVSYPSQAFIDLVFKTKIKIVDQTPIDPLLVRCLGIGKSFQLWHGITVERLGVLADYKLLKYDLVLSTSDFVSDYSFSKIYLYDKIVNCGYPRNDVLIYDDIELVNVDLDTLDLVKNDRINSYVVYMPTHRLYGFKSNPLDYRKLNEFGLKHNIRFIIKMHPLVALKLRDDLHLYHDGRGLSNVIIYPAHMDIYPVLKYSDALIADYSSVYFDYLYLDKPIIFFCYDYDEWAESEQGVVLDYFAHSPGDKCRTNEELFNSVLMNLQDDKYSMDRASLLTKMFENRTQRASELIDKEIQKLL